MRTCRKAQRSFFEDHLAWWAPAFAFALRRKVDGIDGRGQLAEKPESLLGLAGFLLAGFVAFERAVLGVESSSVPDGCNESPHGRPARRCTAASFKSRVTSVVVSCSATKTLLSPRAPKLARRAGQVDAVMAWNAGIRGGPVAAPYCFSTVSTDPRPVTQCCAERNQYCIFGGRESRWRAVPRRML